ncbi:MAG: chromosome segregation protein SMC [Ruminococcaceae bacterium]|jgi:chromosome segregation protein|nr:chromosome segregation protein SMC [Oscillospiraceae bacterium]
MFLKALKMQGFKSFPDNTVLEFNKGITTVVGPNGSGKSNISDAVRWVLGEQSTKNLRGSKMEDVIFSGTSVRKAQGFAQVSLVLDNSDRALDYDDNEVTVSRRYYRSGESLYLINGKEVRLRDVNELFMDTGLGRDGYSIISQGKIADMISSKANERRDMLEEAAGISHFRYRRVDAMRRLSQAEENLLRLRDILTELEGRVGPLKAQSEKAQKFLVLAEEKKDIEIGLWLDTLEKTADRLKEQDTKIEIADSQREKAIKELEEIEKKIDSATEQTQKINCDIEELRASSGKVDEQIAALEAQVLVENNSIEHNNQAIERIKKDMLSENETEQHIFEQVDEAKREIERLSKEKEEKNKQLEKTAEEESKLLSENEQFSEQSIALSNKAAALAVELADNRVTAEGADNTVEEIKTRILAIDEALKSRQASLETAVKDQKEIEEKIKKSIDEIDSLSNALGGYSLKLENREKKSETVRAEKEKNESEIRRATDRLRVLEDMEKNMEGFAGSVKAVMKESKRGTLRGIHGPLSSLITVKDAYTVAIETALGAAIGNCVVDTEDDGKRAIKFLKDNNAGRATFLPISAVKGNELNEKGLDDCYGYVNLASELVSYDKKYDGIIRSLLGRTVVAEDLDCAVAIAKKYNHRFKIVTLDGQVMNAGGSMTGGSRTHNSGILSRTNEIEKLKKNLYSLEEKQKGFDGDFKLITEEIASLKANYDGAVADKARAQEEKIRLEGEKKLIDEQLAAAKTAADELEGEKKTLSSRIENITSSAKEAAKNVEALTKEIEQTEQKLASLTGDRESLSQKREKLSEDAAKIKMEILSFDKDIQAAEDTIERLERRQSSHTDRMTELNNEIEEIEKKNEEILKNIESLKGMCASLREKTSDDRNQVQALISEREQLEKQSGEYRLLERNKTTEREQISSELVRLEEQKANMHREYEETTNKLFTEYELTRREALALNITLEDIPEAKKRLAELKGKIKALGSVNVSAIEEYKEVSERYEFLSNQLNDVEKSKAELIKLINELTDKMASQFREQFYRINQCFGETFSELFGGGKAELRLEDELNVLESNIEIRVQPPGKNVKNIDLLSGGEKGMSAIALLFAILKVTPAPFCIFDEVEAALDDVNVTRYAHYVRRMTKNTQFILITHRRGTMEEADVLYGVTMQEEGVSKLLELRSAEMAKKLGLTN